MFHRREIELPRAPEFYETEYEFEVIVDKSACGSFTMTDGTKFNLAAPTTLAPQLKTIGGQHRASLNDLSAAALRFYRTGDVNMFELSTYDSVLFLTRYEWGMAFSASATNSIERATGAKAVYHFEAMKHHTEMFSYGVAVHFAANLLGIPVDRFFFMTDATKGTRADFRARISRAELLAPGSAVAAVAPSGIIVELEVKCLQGWKSFRATGEQGQSLLHNLSQKASAKSNHAHLCVGVALPSKSPTTRTKARVLVADPGDPQPLSETEQGVILLEEALVLLLRHGLWPTVARALDWLRTLRGKLTDHETELYKDVERFANMEQYRIVTFHHDDRTFNGRIYNDVLERLGQPGRRGMTKDEAEQRRLGDLLGNTFYSGVDEEWLEIIAEQYLDGLLSYGTAMHGSRDFKTKSAYYYRVEETTDEIRRLVRNALTGALRPNRW